MAEQPLLPGIDPACLTPSLGTPRYAETLWDYPNCAPLILQRNAKAIGHAGELLCDSIIARLGLHASSVPEGLPFDRMIMIGEIGVRTQIKTTTHARNGYFRFSATQGYHRSPTGVRPYAADAFDLLCLVALHENVVMFTTNKSVSQSIPTQIVPMLRARPQDSLRHALRELNIHVDAAETARFDDAQPFLRGGRLQ